MKLSEFLGEKSPGSSLRLNQFLITVATLPVLLALAFHIVWNTIQNKEIGWAVLAVFIAAIAGYLFQLWYGKKINKQQENKEPGK